MSLKGKTIGLAVTGSFCTFDKIKQTVQTLIQEEAELYPIFSSHVQTTRSRFGSTDEYIRTISGLAGREPILTIEDAEPIGPKGYLDLLLIAPCTGNTLAKLANGITDTPVLMAAKAHLRNEKPLVIFLSTNDAMGMNFKNIGAIIMGKPPVNKRPEVNKMNFIQRTSRSMLSNLEKMIVKTSKMIHRVDNIDKKSVKSEIKYLESKTTEKSIKNKMKEKIR